MKCSKVITPFVHPVFAIYSGIDLFQEYQDILYCLSKTLRQFLLGRLSIPREIENKGYAKVWRENKEYYDIFEKGL